jgi:hypothetical protein
MSQFSMRRSGMRAKCRTVAGDERGVARDRDCGDAQVRFDDPLSRPLELGPELSVAPGGVLVERQDWPGGPDHCLDAFSELCAAAL